MCMRRNLNYWDSVSTLAGEVANPGKTFPRALLMAVGLVIFMYVAPLAACLGVMSEAGDWKLGFFATVAQRVGGNWLAWWMLAAAAVCILWEHLIYCYTQALAKRKGSSGSCERRTARRRRAASLVDARGRRGIFFHISNVQGSALSGLLDGCSRGALPVSI